MPLAEKEVPLSVIGLLAPPLPEQVTSSTVAFPSPLIVNEPGIEILIVPVVGPQGTPPIVPPLKGRVNCGEQLKGKKPPTLAFILTIQVKVDGGGGGGGDDDEGQMRVSDSHVPLIHESPGQHEAEDIQLP